MGISFEFFSQSKCATNIVRNFWNRICTMSHKESIVVLTFFNIDSHWPRTLFMIFCSFNFRCMRHDARRDSQWKAQQFSCDGTPITKIFSRIPVDNGNWFRDKTVASFETIGHNLDLSSLYWSQEWWQGEKESIKE